MNIREDIQDILVKYDHQHRLDLELLAELEAYINKIREGVFEDFIEWRKSMIFGNLSEEERKYLVDDYREVFDGYLESIKGDTK